MPSSIAALSSARRRGLIIRRKLSCERFIKVAKPGASGTQSLAGKEAHHAIDLGGRLKAGNKDLFSHWIIR